MTTGPRTGRRRRTLLALVATVALVPALATTGAGPVGAEPAPDASTRIVGGAPAPAGAWPSQVGLLDAAISGNRAAQYCGGTLVDRSWVLTAAHCLITQGGSLRRPVDRIDVLVGTQSLASGGQRIRAAEIRVVDGFHPRTLDRDVALIRLSRPATVAVQPLVADWTALPGGTDVIATGWGALSSGGSYPTVLHEVTVQARTDAQCAAAYGASYNADTMVCAGVPGGGRDTCQGDSGGPLLRAQGGGHVQVGITSWGVGCAEAAHPGVYAKVSRFSNWIRTQVRYGPHSTATVFVRRLHLDLFNRQPTNGELFAGVAALNEGTTPAAYARGLLQGATYQARTGGVTRLYRAFFLRDPDQSGMAFWWDRANSGWSLDRVAQTFAASSEFTTTYGSLDNRAFVELVYRNVLDREPDAQGLAFWTAQLDDGHRTRGQVMIGYSESNEYRTRTGPRVDVVTTWFGLLRRVPTEGEIATWSPQPAEALVAHLLGSHSYHSRTW